MELTVYNIKGEDTGRKVQLNDEIYAIEPNEHVMYLAVRQYLADQRQGTHKSKERSELSGSTRKLFRQKGTGGARRGDINSPLLRGGARVFGPKPRDYSFKLNKKVKVKWLKTSTSTPSRRSRWLRCLIHSKSMVTATSSCSPSPTRMLCCPQGISSAPKSCWLAT